MKSVSTKQEAASEVALDVFTDCLLKLRCHKCKDFFIRLKKKFFLHGNTFFGGGNCNDGFKCKAKPIGGTKWLFE